MWKFILNRLKERSTWVGIVGLLTITGLNISPEASQAILNVGLAIASLLGIVIPDSVKPPEVPVVPPVVRWP